jgi:hypothetical protein
MSELMGLAIVLALLAIVFALERIKNAIQELRP